MRDALTRYRVMANVVGVVLLVLVLVAVPLKYLAHQPAAVRIVGPLHGFLYIGYLLVVFDLGRRHRWPLIRTVAVMLAGTVPFMTFLAERRTTRLVRSRASSVSG